MTPVVAIEPGLELTDDAPVGSAIGDPSARRVPAQIPVERYISPAWAALEDAHVWPRTWVLACTVDHVGGPGDVFEFVLGKLSVLVVRGDDGELRAFQNACRHRGSALCSGSVQGLDHIRCPYHRWTWDLQGRLREVPSRRGFGPIRNDDLGLIDVAVDTWGPLVFVNLDTAAAPLAEYLGALPDVVAWADLDRYACRYDLTVAMDCNWKTLIEGFSETYHVQGIHREMLPSVDDVNSENRLIGRHGCLLQPYGIASPRLRDGATDDEIWQSLMVTQGGRYGVDATDPGPVPARAPGETMRDLFERMIRARALTQGWSFDHLDQSQLLDLFQLNLFPNVSIIVMADTITCLRARPGATPDESLMDVVSLQRLPDGAERPGPPICATVDPADTSLGLVFDQDVANLGAVQRGLHQPGLTHLVLSREEMRIMNLHRNLEEYIDMESDFDPATIAEIDALRGSVPTPPAQRSARPEEVAP